MDNSNRTSYLGLEKPLGTDFYNVEVTNSNNEKIDKEFEKINYSNHYEDADGTATKLVVSLPEELTNGFIKKIIAKENNNGAATTVNDIPVYKMGSATAPNFKANMPYELYYNQAGNNFFVKASATGNATPAQVLAGAIFSNENDVDQIGTMIERGSPVTHLNCGGEVNLLEGHYTGGKIIANSLASQTPSNAFAAAILSGYHAWVNGQDVWGTASIQSMGGIPGKSGSFKFDLPAMSNSRWVEVKHDFSKECPNAKIIFGICDYYSPRNVTTLVHSVFIWHDPSKANTQTYGLYEVFYANDTYAQYNKIDNVIILGNGYGNYTNNNTCRWWAIE